MGGAEKSLLDTVNFLSDKYDISLYLLDKKGILLKDLSNKVKVYEIKKNIFQYIRQCQQWRCAYGLLFL